MIAFVRLRYVSTFISLPSSITSVALMFELSTSDHRVLDSIYLLGVGDREARNGYRH